MKEYNLLKKDEIKANPTMKVQEKILEVIENSKNPISITSISKLSKTSYYQTKVSIDFLYRLGVLDLIISSGNSTFVILKKQDCEVTNK
jgi:hypothetical protein